MQDVLTLLTDFRAFILVAFRIGGLVAVAPFFNSTTTPDKVKVGLVCALAVVLLPTVDYSTLAIPDNIVGYFAAALAEVAVGAIIGLVASIVFAGIQLGGYIAAQQIGLAIANVFDPTQNEETSIVAQLFYMFGVVVFVLLKGHYVLLYALANSFRLVPLASFSPDEAVAAKVGVEAVGDMFVLAVKVAAPAVIALMMATMVMAIIARTVPEMNIFNIGFAVRLAVGLGILTLAVPALAVVVQHTLDAMAGRLDSLFTSG